MAEQPGDRGTNWFAVELTSAFVDPGGVVPLGGPTFLFSVGNIASGEAFSTGLNVEQGPPAVVDVSGGGAIASGEAFGAGFHVNVVAPPPPPPPEPDITVRGGPVPDSGQMVQAGPGYLRERFDARIELVLPAPDPTVLSERHGAVFALQQHVDEQHEAALHLSNLMLTVRRDDEEFLMLF